MGSAGDGRCAGACWKERRDKEDTIERYEVMMERKGEMCNYSRRKAEGTRRYEYVCVYVYKHVYVYIRVKIYVHIVRR